ncbi:MAG: hypothetical protein WBV39_03960 [Rudaea sp.]
MRVLLTTALLILAAQAWAATISGQVDLFADGKPLRADQARDAIVYFRPKAPLRHIPITPVQVMSTRDKQFVPSVIATTVGSKIRFPNEDPILHNAFSTSKYNAFDAGLYGEGDGETETFSHVGYVRVYCNVHHSMIGHILVLDTPFFTRPDSHGHFSLDDVPPGKGDLVIWYERAAPWHSEISAGSAPRISVRLDLNRRRVPRHMNKFGKPYRGNGNGGY